MKTLPYEMLLEKAVMLDNQAVQNRIEQTVTSQLWFSYRFQVMHEDFYFNDFLRDMQRVQPLNQRNKA